MGRRWSLQAAVAGAFLLAACGGGGGEASSGGGGVASLVPKAPAAGAVLYADAASLRPLRSGATWNYRGTRTAFTGAVPVAYLTSTSQSAANAGGATEATTNSGNDGQGVQTIVVSGGAVSAPQSVDFAGKGVAQAFDAVELRSPVRRDDQYTILDKRYTDTAIDADGDGNPDALEVAIYARVAGNETLALPNLPPIKALRVDTFVLARLTASSNGQVSPIAQSSLRTWYADGIGIVRQTSVQPNDAGTDVTTTDELLSSWDGVTTGFGVMAQVPATIPAANSVFPGDALPSGGFRLAAFAFNDRALVFTDTPGAQSGTLVSRVDFRGAVQNATVVPNLAVGRCTVLSAYAAGVLCLEAAAFGSVIDYDLTRLDGDGNVVGAVRGARINLGGGRTGASVLGLVGAVDGTALWLFWGRGYFDLATGQPADELILRPYSLDGVALAPEIVVGPSGGKLSLTAGAGRVTMSWLQSAAPTTSPTLADWKMATASTAGVSATRVLATGIDSTNVFVTQLRAGDLDVVAWPQVPGTRVEGAGGIVFDAPLLPRRAGVALSDERIPGVPVHSGSVPSIEALGSRLTFTTPQQQVTLWPADTSTSPVYDITWMDIGAGPLATTPVSKVRFGAARFDGKRDGQLLLSDRLLVFEPRPSANGLGTTVVWLNKGSPP